MPLTRRQIITSLSVIYLIGPTVLAAYALTSIHQYNLPIPSILAAFTLALPPVAGLLLETVVSLNEKLTAKGQLRSSIFFTLVIAVLLVWESCLASLAGTHIAPVGGLTCGLRDAWQDMFRRKQGRYIQRIQDSLQCCGFANARDMAFPFPDGSHGADACVRAFGYTQGCLEGWRGEERKVAVMMLVVPIAVFLWELILFTTPMTRSSWLNTALSLPHGAGESGGRPQHTIEYRDVEEAQNEDDLQNEVQRLNSESELASTVEGSRVHASGLLRDSNAWTREHGDA